MVRGAEGGGRKKRDAGDGGPGPCRPDPRADDHRCMDTPVGERGRGGEKGEKGRKERRRREEEEEGEGAGRLRGETKMRGRDADIKAYTYAFLINGLNASFVLAYRTCCGYHEDPSIMPHDSVDA